MINLKRLRIKKILIFLFILLLLINFIFIYAGNILKTKHNISIIPDIGVLNSIKKTKSIFFEFYDKGLKLYIKLEIIDMIYPIIYSFLLFYIGYFLLDYRKFKFIAFIPFCGAFFDYVENILIFLILHKNVYSLINYFIIVSIIKWIIIFLNIVILIIAGIFKIMIIKKE